MSGYQPKLLQEFLVKDGGANVMVRDCFTASGLAAIDRFMNFAIKQTILRLSVPKCLIAAVATNRDTTSTYSINTKVSTGKPLALL